MSKLERISTFIDVIEENGFTAAARSKDVTTAAISKQITALEDELGTTLLLRTTRQMTLTETGEIYYQQCKKVLNELREAENAIAKSKGKVTGSLRILANRYFSISYLLPRLPEFMQQHPQLHIDFELAERFPDLQKEGIDILFGVSVEGSPDWVRKRVAKTRYVLCASPAYLKKNGRPKIPADLSNIAILRIA